MFLTPSLQSLGIVLLHVFVKVDGFLLLFSLGFHFLFVVARLRVARCCEDNKTTDDDADNHAAGNHPIDETAHALEEEVETLSVVFAEFRVDRSWDGFEHLFGCLRYRCFHGFYSLRVLLDVIVQVLTGRSDPQDFRRDGPSDC